MTLNKKNSLQEIEEALILATSNTNAALRTIYYNDEIYDLFYEFVDEWEELECDPEGANEEQLKQQEELINDFAQRVYEEMPLELDEAAAEYNLIIVETTSGMNGYPRHIRKALVGFESFEQAEEIAAETGLCMMELHRRDGWQLWQRVEMTNRPFDLTLVDGDDGMQMACTENAIECVDEMLADYEEDENYTEEELEEVRAAAAELKAEISKNIGKDKFVTIYGCGSPFAYEIFDHYSMSYYYDTHNYCIGLVDME